MNNYFIRREWADWIVSQDFNVFGTLNFAAGRKPSLSEAHRRWALFWNKLDRLCMGSAAAVSKRVQRFVFEHQGANGDNHHIHFLAKADCDTKEFCILANALWAGLEGIDSAIAEQNEVLPLFSKRHASWYVLHEDSGNVADSFNAKLSYIALPETRFRSDALARMRSAAERGNQIDEAQAAYDKHLMRAWLRHTG